MLPGQPVPDDLVKSLHAANAQAAPGAVSQRPATPTPLTPSASSAAAIVRPPGQLESPPLQRAATPQHAGGGGGLRAAASAAATPASASTAAVAPGASRMRPSFTSLGSHNASRASGGDIRESAAKHLVDTLPVAEVSALSLSGLPTQLRASGIGSPSRAANAGPTTGPTISAAESLLDVEASTLARQLGVGNCEEEGDEVEEEPLEPRSCCTGGAQREGIVATGFGAAGSGITEEDGNPSRLRGSYNGVGAAAAVNGGGGSASGCRREAFSSTSLGAPADGFATIKPDSPAGLRGRQAAADRTAAEGPAAGAAGAVPRRRPPPGTPRQPRPDEVGRTEYFSACAAQGLEYQTILRVHRRAILCGAVRKCVRSAGSHAGPSVRGGCSGNIWPAAAGGAAGATGPRGPSWLLLSGGEDGYVLWDLSRGRPLLMSLEEEGAGAGGPTAPAAEPVRPAGAASAPGDVDGDRPSTTRSPPVRGVTNLAALKQMLSLRRRGVDSDEEDSDDSGDGVPRPPTVGARLSNTGGAPENGRLPVGGRSRHGLMDAVPRRGSSYTGGGAAASDSDSEERAAAAWQAASYRNMITAVAFVSDTQWATCHPGGAIRVWAADAAYTSATLERTLHGHTGYINNIASYGGGRFAITTGLDTTARNWDLVEGRELSCFRDHENEVTAVAVMESGRMALTAAEVVPEVASAMLWDPRTGKLLHTLCGHHGWLFGVALSERRRIAVAIGEHATLFIWNTETGDLLLSKVVASDGLQRWCSINSDGNFLCFGSAEGVVRVVETFYGCELARFDSTWVDPDFHSISACFFCDDELHDAPEHWNSKFLSLQGDSTDVTRLFQPHFGVQGSGRTLSSQTKGGPGGAAVSGLSTLGGTLGGFLAANAAATGQGGAGATAAGATKNVVRARMLHSVRAAAALAAIGRAAAAGHTNTEPDEDVEIVESEADLDVGDGKALAAIKTLSVTASGTGPSVGSTTAAGTPKGFTLVGRRSIGGAGAGSTNRRRVAPLPAKLERINTNPRNSQSPAPQAHSEKTPTTRFALPDDDRKTPASPTAKDSAPAAADAMRPTAAATVVPDAGTGTGTSATAKAGGGHHPHLRFALPDGKDDGDSDDGGARSPAKTDPPGQVPTSLPSLKPGTTSRVFVTVKNVGAAAFGGPGGDSIGSGGHSSRRRVAVTTAAGLVSRPTSAAVGRPGSMSANSMTAGAGGSVSRSAPSGHLQEMLGNRNPTELEISPFGRRIVSLSGDGTVRVWSLLGVSVRRELPRHPEMVNEIAISRDRSLVATVTENEGCLRLFSMTTGHPVATVAAHVGFDCDGVALSDDATLVAHDPFAETSQLQGTAVTCSDDTTIRIWDLSTPGGPECVRTLYGHAGGVTGVCWVPGSSRVLSVGEDRSVLEWDAGPGGSSRPVARMDHVHEDAISAVVVSPDARRALTCSMDRTARLWELSPAGSSGPQAASGQGPGGAGGGQQQHQPHHHHHHRASALAYSAAAAAAASEAHQLSSTSPHMPSRPELHRFMHDNSVNHGVFSPDGRHVVTCGADCTVRLWDTDNGKQLACFEGHTRTVTRCVYLNNYVVATTSRDGTIRCWDVQRKRRLPTLAPPFALENDSFEAMVLLPSQRCRYGFPEVLASLTSGRVVVYDPTYRQPLPEQLLLQLNPELELLGPADVADLVVDFPGLLVMPIRDGNTMLHMVAMSGDYVLLRALLSGVSGGERHGAALPGTMYGNAPPLPLNFVGQTPLDLAVAAGHRRCAELLLGTELTRPPEQRLAVLRAWHSLAVEMPSLLISFLKALSLDPAAGMEEDVLFAPLRANDEVMTLGWEDLGAADLWLDQINQLREDLAHLPWYSKVWPLRHLWEYREKPTSPSVAGLPYVAMSARNMEHSPLGVLVQHGLSQALASDVMYAVLFYKWESFARAIFLRESLVFVAFLAIYLTASTMSVMKSPHVEFDELYDMTQPVCVIRMVLEILLAVMALHDIYGEITEVVNAGWYMYLAGSQGSWNGLEMSSCIGLLLTFGLQLGSSEGGSRFAMSLTTILLGLRLLKVASGPEHTGVFVQALLRIVANLRFFMLILVVLVLTFSIAFWQLMSFDMPPGETSRKGQEFDTLGNSIVFAYAYGVIGQMNPNVAADFKWRPWVQVLMLTYTFLVTVILLNLLVAVMSDTYSVVKEHARSEWLLLRAKLILEIESSLPDAFFKDTSRSCPRWLHCLKVDTTGGRRGDETLIESLRGPIARHVLNTDLSKTETRLVEELHEVRDALRLLHADVGNMRTAVAGIGGLAAAAAAAAGNHPPSNQFPTSYGSNYQPYRGGVGGSFFGLSQGAPSRASSMSPASPLPTGTTWTGNYGAGSRGGGTTRPPSARSTASGAAALARAVPVSAGRRRDL